MQKTDSRIRVLVVDDSTFVRRSIIRIFENHPRIQVVDVASDGEMALERVKALRPDVVTMDVMMPRMDGLAALERIMQECPTPTIMLSSVTGRGGERTFRALELGAVDFIDKSMAGGVMDVSNLAAELVSKISVAAGIDISKLRRSSPPPQGTSTGALERRDVEIVVIGTSTGGPGALHKVLAPMPANFPAPILIVQHMPPGFTASLAGRLDRHSALTVKEAEQGETLLPGRAYVAPAGLHLKVARGEHAPLVAVLDEQPTPTLHRPSVDVLFESAADVCGRGCVACVLTGMGRDGAAGAVAVKREGGRVLVESESTAIVHGMPKAAAAAVDADAVLRLEGFTDALVGMVAETPASSRR
ncbi:MAG TPA: chemotaxis response regulator protein-glutamate methylesterase [Verrucomicrobiae bacterium]|nr:chemotaxis response regulator protein-glutamate methylesterase [Verrucomicrobiae bacterium]